MCPLTSSHRTNNLLENTCHYFPEHEGPVSQVSVSSDSLLVLASTSTGNLGFLDVSSRGYNTLMRSHTDTVLGFSVDGIRRHLTTASSDGTVRIWNMDSLHQVNQHHIKCLINDYYLFIIIRSYSLNSSLINIHSASESLKGNHFNLIIPCKRRCINLLN